MPIGVEATLTRSCLYRLNFVQTVFFLSILLNFAITGSGGPRAQEGTTTSSAQQTEQSADASMHPYLDEPLKTLMKSVPELKGIRPAADQQELPMILEKTGKEVDEFFDNAVDLVAHEEIRQERLGSLGFTTAHERVRDSYLILRHGNGTRADFDEFRTDEEGNRLDQVGLARGFLVTWGFALISAHFSAGFQPDSSFRYLGDEIIAGRETYVVAFAQRPDKASYTITMKGPRGADAHILTQGIAWVDKKNFHIVRMRTDLLACQPYIGLEQQTTKVDFSEVQFTDVATPLWLPHDVNVFLKLGKYLDRPAEEFRNVHHYTDYRRYRVAVKMVAPQ
jgi:hypothetical protein